MQEQKNFRIAAIWAFTTINPKDNSEGIIGELVDGAWMPYIGADEHRVKCLKPAARRIAASLGRPVRLSKFSERTDLEIIQG